MPAPKGNQYSVGNNGGVPPYYKTKEELQEAIDLYFTQNVKKRTVIIGKAPNEKTIEIEVPTISGLCYDLGFESRQSFYDYEKREEFSYTIKRARLFIEKEYEEMLQIGNTTGAIFALKNMGWIDSQKTDITTNGEAINREIEIKFVKYNNGDST
jgi:hypothetical protein